MIQCIKSVAGEVERGKIKWKFRLWTHWEAYYITIHVIICVYYYVYVSWFQEFGYNSCIYLVLSNYYYT
jgi:hypothetical protein